MCTLEKYYRKLDYQFYKSLFYYLADRYYRMKPIFKKKEKKFRLSDLCGSLPSISEKDINKKIKSIKEEWERDI